MTMKIKTGGSYADIVSIFVKTNGAYTAVQNAYCKVGGSYQSVFSVTPTVATMAFNLTSSSQLVGTL